MTDRTAIDTIKGYFYQFDYAISKLLGLGLDSDAITVEGIEDVDISTATEETAIQCKYYAKTEYNHSVIAKPIRLMLDHYREVIKGNKLKINYILFGYFQSGQNKLTIPFDIAFLKDKFLTYTENKITYYYHIDFKLNDKDLEDFLQLLKIDISALEYQAQLKKISALLINQFGCNEFEAEHFYYNNALKVIKDISVEGDILNRKITKKEFLSKINFKRILFNEWFIQYKGENKVFSELRKQYFTTLNISPFERFFLIEIPQSNYVRNDLKELIFEISKKWSKLSSREPNPFCPYIYFHGISQNELIDLKREIFSEGCSLIDGFDFEGSSFNPKSLTKQINKGKLIFIKVLNSLSYIDSVFTEITKTKEIYQFYNQDIFFTNIYTNIKQVNIQFRQLNDIKNII